jgi:hypothetical protein
MLVKDLDGNVHKWILKGNIAKGKLHNKSSLHLQARQLLVSTYPTLQILEEVTIPLRKSESLYLDFYLPLKKICFETHGEQHYKFIPFYHGNILNFIKSQKRDRDKEQWCANNNITYVSLPYNETQEQWLEKIKNA